MSRRGWGLIMRWISETSFEGGDIDEILSGSYSFIYFDFCVFNVRILLVVMIFCTF